MSSNQAETKVTLSATKITDLWNYDTNQPIPFNVSERIVFGAVKQCEIPSEETKKSYFYRLPIYVKQTAQPDSSLGKLVLQTPETFSYGVSEQHDKSNKLTGYSLSQAFFDMQGPTPAQAHYAAVFDEIIEHIKQELVNRRAEFRRPKLTADQLVDLRILKYKEDDNGQRVTDKSPYLYTKLTCKYVDGKPEPQTRFYLKGATDADGEPIELDVKQNLMNQRGTVQTCFCIDNVYIGQVFSTQLKVYEADFTPVQNTQRRRLAPMTANPVVADKYDYYQLLKRPAQQPMPEPVPEPQFNPIPSPEEKPLRKLNRPLVTDLPDGIPISI